MTSAAPTGGFDLLADYDDVSREYATLLRIIYRTYRGTAQARWLDTLDAAMTATEPAVKLDRLAEVKKKLEAEQHDQR